MLSIGAHCVQATGCREELEALAQSFRQSRALHLPAMLEQELLHSVRALLLNTALSARNLPGLGEQQVDNGGRACRIVNMVLARPQLYRWLEQVTACEALGAVEGSIVRMSLGQQLAWHDDMNDDRRALAITIALSDEAFDGGVFHLRRKATGAELFRHVHDIAGSGLIFAISPELEHSVTPLQSNACRTVYAGWFLKAQIP